MHFTTTWRALFLVGVVLLSCVTALAEPNTAVHHHRTGELATPVQHRGLPNCYRVSKQLYRSAQPTAAGMRAAEELGVRTIVNLREGHSDRELIHGTGLGYVHMPMRPTHIEDKNVVEFLRIVTDRDRTPVLVHCHAGADRTGLMVAVYRVVVQGWSKQEAISELEHGGFHFHHEFHDIPRFIEEMNVDHLRHAADIE